MTIQFPELQRALHIWMQAAAEHLAGAEPDETVDVRRWQQDSDGVYRNRERVVQVWRRQDEPLWELPAWSEVERVVQADERLSSQVGQLVGAEGGGRLLEMQLLGLHVLPQPAEMNDVEASFVRRYEELDRFLAADELALKVVWPMPGLTSDEFPLVLEPDVEMDHMTKEELTTALNVGLLQPMFAGETILMPHEASPVCLRYRYRAKKVIGSQGLDATSQLFQERQALIDGIREAFEQTLALLYTDPVAVAGQMAVADEWNLHAGGVGYQRVALPLSVSNRRQELDDTASAELRAVWVQLRQPGLLATQRALALAIRRLSYQAKRERTDDELLDLLIAAEGLYQSDEARDSTSLRLSLNAAALCEPDALGWTRRQVFNLMEAAYKARSRIVHGRDPNPNQLAVAGKRVELPEFVEAVERIVRQGIREGLRRAANAGEKWPPDWDGITLPQ